jgi:hypothetical protein
MDEDVVVDVDVNMNMDVDVDVGVDLDMHIDMDMYITCCSEITKAHNSTELALPFKVKSLTRYESSSAFKAKAKLLKHYKKRV